MPKINLTLQQVNFDAATFRKTLHTTLEREMRMAARAWLRAVIPAVPVYTGMARGSLQPLGRFLRVAVPISPVVRRRDKSPSLGAEQQDFTFESKNGLYSFSFESSVFHYKINEFYSPPLPLIHPTPWHSFEKGRAAFDEYIKVVLPLKIPKAIDFVKPGAVIRE